MLSSLTKAKCIKRNLRTLKTGFEAQQQQMATRIYIFGPQGYFKHT